MNEQATGVQNPGMCGRLIVLLQGEGVHMQAVRYVLAAGVSTATDLALLIVLTSLFRVHYLFAAAVGFTIGTSIIYVFSIRWVFPHRTLTSPVLELTIFSLIGAVGLGLTEAVMYVCVEGYHLHYLVSKFVAIVAVFIWDFGLRKSLLFRRHS